MVAFAVSKLKIETGTRRGNSQENQLVKEKTKKVFYLEVVSTEIKKSYQLREKIKELKYKSLQEENIESLKDEISGIENWLKQICNFEENERFYNLFTILYIIPRFETMIMLCILSLSLTSYDIHPIGCLSPIGVSYNETYSSVTLVISESVILYQKISMGLIILLAITWFLLKLFQFSLLPRFKWGIQIQSKPCFCTCYGCQMTNEQSDGYVYAKANEQSNGYIKTNEQSNGYIKTNEQSDGYVKTNEQSDGYIKTNEQSDDNQITNEQSKESKA